MEVFAGLASEVPRPATLLDVGGTTDFWRGQVPAGVSVTVLNVFGQQPVEGIQVQIGDGCDLSRFEDKSFDIVFSNSVLYLVGGWERQRQLAREIRRVGHRYFVQTANRNFPLDWRTLVPFFHWLPSSVQAWWFQRIPVGRYKKAQSAAEAIEWATRVCDLNAAECKTLFPEGTIIRERVAGLTKSLMVHYGFNGYARN
jgi:SAM-dependent methyltransferase